MKQYHTLLKKIFNEGVNKKDRTDTGIRSIFGHQMRFNLIEGFPLITTKKIHLKSIIYELLWFLQGNTNIKYLQDNGVKIWNEWATKNGNLGPIYGHQWRSWQTKDGQIVDQITQAIKTIKTNPNSRRIIISAWNLGDLAKMALPPCHLLFQFYVSDNKLSCQLYQRSADTFLGIPFNIASYALLTMMFAQVCNLELGDFIHTLGDAHIYTNHFKQVKEQLSRKFFKLPNLKINPKIKNIFDFKYEDFSLENYQAHPHIKGIVAI